MNAVDTQVLVYAHRAEIPEHELAKKLLKSLAEGSQPWAIPWPCVYEFFAVVTNLRLWKGAASSPGQAVAQLKAWFASPSLRLLGERDASREVTVELLNNARVRGGIAHDGRIASLCVVHGVTTLLSRDRDFSLFPSVTVLNPFEPTKR